MPGTPVGGFELRLYLSRLAKADQGDRPSVLTRMLHAEHARIYGHATESEQLEVVSYRIRAVVKMAIYEITPLPQDAVAVTSMRLPRRVYRHGE